MVIDGGLVGEGNGVTRTDGEEWIEQKLQRGRGERGPGEGC